MAIEIKIGASFNDADIKRAQRELNNLAKVTSDASMTMAQKLERTGKQFQQLGQNMTMRVTAPLVAAGAFAVKYASDLEESQSKVNVVFGNSAQQVSKFGETAAESLGMSRAAAFEAAGTYGNLFRAMGMTEDKSAEMSTSLVQLAADLGSFNNVPVDQVFDALRSGLSGETEPLRRFGVNINAARIETEALSLGLIQQGEELSAAAKAQATYSIIMKDTTLAQGDFARTADGAANSMKTARAQLEDAAAEIGKVLLPAVSTVAGVIGDLAGFIGNLPGPIKTLVVSIGGIAAAFGPVVWLTGSVLTNLAAIAKTRMGVALIDWASGLRTAMQTAATQGNLLGTALSGVGNMLGRIGPMLARGGLVLGGLAILGTVVRNIAGAAMDAKLGDFATDVDRVTAALTQLRNDGAVNESVISLEDFSTAAIAVRKEIFESNSYSNYPPIFKQISQLGMHFKGTYEEADRARDRLSVFDDALMQMDFSDATIALQAYFDEMGAGTVTAEKIRDILPQFSGRLEDATRITDPAARAVLGLGDQFGNTGDSIDDATEALKNWESAVKAQFDPLWGFQESVRKTLELKAEEAKKQAEVNQIVAQFGPDSEEARAAMADLNRIQEEQILSAGEQSARWADLINGVRSGEVPLSKAIQDIETLAAQNLISADAAATQKKRFEELALFLLQTEFPGIEIPVNSNAAQVLETLQNLKRTFQETQAEIDRVGLDVWVLSQGNFPGSADGGPVMAGRAGWVGERGPELFIPNVDGTIVPHYQSRRIMDELGRQEGQPQVVQTKPGVVNVYVNQSDASPYEIGRELLWQMKVAS